MNTSRFDYDRRSGATVDPSAQKSKWIRASRIGGSLLRESTGSGRKKIFTIVAPPLPASSGGKTIRSILIFDNHPDSLRLVFERRANPHSDLSAPERVISWELILASILTMAALIGMFWPLFWASGSGRKKGLQPSPKSPSTKQGERASLKRGITKSRERAMVMKHSWSDGET